MAKVNIEGQEFTLSAEKVQDLLQWLNTNGGVKVESSGAGEFDGQQLLNEQKPKPSGPSGDGTWDFGTKWI
jgi:D-serine dehydratase